MHHYTRTLFKNAYSCKKTLQKLRTKDAKISIAQSVSHSSSHPNVIRLPPSILIATQAVVQEHDGGRRQATAKISNNQLVVYPRKILIPPPQIRPYVQFSRRSLGLLLNTSNSPEQPVGLASATPGSYNVQPNSYYLVNNRYRLSLVECKGKREVAKEPLHAVLHLFAWK